MTLKEKLMYIQTELKAGKTRYNKFGDYYHRNLEDIYEAVKPLLAKHKVILTVNNDLFELSGKIFRKAIATLIDVESEETINNYTIVQESLEPRKGMTIEQQNGASQSYLVKYCLNLLFCLDDAKDADNTPSEKEIEAKSDTPKTGKIGKAPSFSKNQTNKSDGAF